MKNFLNGNSFGARIYWNIVFRLVQVRDFLVRVLIYIWPAVLFVIAGIWALVWIKSTFTGTLSLYLFLEDWAVVSTATTLILAPKIVKWLGLRW